MTSVLVFRPPPGAQETADRAAAIGLHAVVTPLFTIAAIPWDAPPLHNVEAVMLTSANAPRHAGPALRPFLDLPCYAVGEATASEARNQGFTDVRTGPADAAALAALMIEDGVRHVLHPCGREHVALDPPGLTIARRKVYAAEAIDGLPDAARQALAAGAVALIHSPRAGTTFGALADGARLERGTIRIAAISPAAAEAAGSGWKRKEVAAAPRDDALLELAAKLCKTGCMGSRA